MMMPANYSVIAENEMTYVNGGANAFIDAIGAVTAPIWGIENVKQFSTNIVTLVGNTFLQSTVNKTIGVLFSGNATWKEVGNIGKTLFKTNRDGVEFGKAQYGDVVMNALGIAAAVYNLGVAPTKNSVKEGALTFGSKIALG